MGEPIENLYFNWLYAKVCDVRANSPSRRFEKLLGHLHRTEFVWMVTGDDNRAEDGVELRLDFIRAAYGPHIEEDWFFEPPSVFEVFVALAIRAAFESDESVTFWFWRFLENLELSEMHDGARVSKVMIDSVIERFMWRTYTSSGQGGIFPLLRTRNDQRKVELWRQLSEYMLENDFG